VPKRTDKPEQLVDDVALIATGDARSTLAGVLQAHRLTVESFVRFEDLAEDGERSSPGAIVLAANGKISSLGGQIAALRRRFADSPVLVVCNDIRRWELRVTLLAGVAGVVLMQDVEDALIPSLHAVQVGQTTVPWSSSHQIEPPILSAREKQILGLVVMGYMNSEIAARLFLAESTVKSHLSSAFGKLGVRSRNEAVNLILDPEGGLGMGILSLDVEPLSPASTPVSAT
jgi:DNA-binding NarL/FixJ family response regulator